MDCSNLDTGWNIDPVDGVENPHPTDGKFKFTAPETGSIKYTIYYKDENGNCSSTEYTVNAGDCVSCDCSKLTIIRSMDTFPMTGYTATTVLATYSFKNTTAAQYCKNKSLPFTATASEGITIKGTSNGKISGTVSSNASGTAAKTLTITPIYNGNTCSPLTYTQAEGCDCDNIDYTESVTQIDSTGFTGSVGTLREGDICNEQVTVSSSDISVIRRNGTTIYAEIGPNIAGGDYHYTIKVNNVTCGNEHTIHQSVGCSCDNYGFNIGPTIAYFEEQTKTVTLGTATTNSNACGFSLIDFTSNTISNLSLNRSTGVLTGIVSKNPNEDPQYLSFSMVFGENKEHCTGKDYTITVLGENRYCLVDNCADDDYDTSTRPNLHQLKGAGSGSSTTEIGCDSCHPAVQYKNYVKVGEIQYYTVTKTIPDETSDIFLFQPTGGTWTNNGNWLSAEVTDSCYWGDCAGGEPGTGFGIEYNISPNNGSTKNQVRWARVRVYWDLSTTAGANAWNEARTCGTAGRPANWHFKKDSWVYIMQAPQGKKFSDKKPDAPNKCSTMRDDIERHIYRIVDENYECQS